MTDDEQLDAQIEALEVEEREVSARRRKLHDRLASFPNEVTQQQEREISEASSRAARPDRLAEGRAKPAPRGAGAGADA